MTSMEEESALSSRGAAAAVAAGEILETGTGVSAAGGPLAPGLATAWWWRTSPRPPLGRTSRTSCARPARSTTPTLTRAAVARATLSLGRAATWSMLLTNWTVPSWEGAGSGSSRRARVAVVDVAGPAPGPGPGQAQGGLADRALAPGPAPSLATVPGRGPGLEQGGQEAAAVHKDKVASSAIKDFGHQCQFGLPFLKNHR